VPYEDHQSLFRSKQCRKLKFLLVFIEDLEITGFGKRLGRYDVVVCGRHDEESQGERIRTKQAAALWGRSRVELSSNSQSDLKDVDLFQEGQSVTNVTDEIMNVSRGKEVDWGQLYSVQFAEVSQSSALLGITLSLQVCL